MGVSSVGIIGGKTKEFWIELNQLKMSTFSITPEMIRDMLNQNHFITSNGFLSDYRRLYLNITDAGLYNLTDIENVVLRNDGKRLIKLKDVAEVNVRERTEYTRINANGRQGLLVAILKQPGANLINLSENVASKKKELEKMLPSDVHVSLYYDQADFVNKAIKSVNDSLWLGLIAGASGCNYVFKIFQGQCHNPCNNSCHTASYNNCSLQYRLYSQYYDIRSNCCCDRSDNR